MIIFKSINKLNKEVNFKANVGFVPTMGSLHRGHISLIKSSKKNCKKTLVSIFVNPSQFNKKSDLQNYPKNLKKDIKILKNHKVDYLLLPRIKEIYKNNKDKKIKLSKKDEIMCAIYRPGHFEGVLAVINQFLLRLKPKYIFFGEKDYQQLCVIRTMVRDLNLPVEVVAGETVREPDGLAMSSRNIFLNDAQRSIAPALRACLQRVAEVVYSCGNITDACQKESEKLILAGFSKVDYLTLRDAETLEPLDTFDRPARVLAAAWLDKVRLIDNVSLIPG